MTDPKPTVASVELLTSGGSHVVHNVAEFGLAIVAGWETVVPLGVTVLLGVGLIARPGRATFLAAGSWALVVLVVGGGSVVPLAVLPFVPEQSVAHYATHLVYAGAQLPLLWVALPWCHGTAQRPALRLMVGLDRERDLGQARGRPTCLRR